MPQLSFSFYAPPGRPAGPYLPIRIFNPYTKISFDWYCLIDTGADTCFFSELLADSLGHKLNGFGVKSSVSCGVEGKAVRTWMHTCILMLMHPKEDDVVVWKGKKEKYEFIGHNNCPLLLGVEFLKYFKITLDYKNERTILLW